MASTLELLLLAALPGPWQAVTSFGSGWSAGISPMCRLLAGQGDVELKGQVVNTSAASGQTMFTLPAAFSPTVERDLTGVCVTAAGGSSYGSYSLRINTNGTAVLYNLPSGGHTFSLDGCFFSLT